MYIRNKLYYPKSHISTNLRTDGLEWMLEDGTEYKGFYHKYVDGTVLTGAVFHKTDSKKLIPYVNKVDQPNNFEYDAIVKKNRIIAPYYVFPIPTLDDYKAGKITRYFLKRRNFSTFQDIIEINKAQWLKLKQYDDGIDNNLYMAVVVDWKLTGPLNDDRSTQNIVYGVYDTNQRIVLLKDHEFAGLKDFLTDYVELSVHSKAVSDDIKKLFG
jgi:hypothetical protein